MRTRSCKGTRLAPGGLAGALRGGLRSRKRLSGQGPKRGNLARLREKSSGKWTKASESAREDLVFCPGQGNMPRITGVPRPAARPRLATPGAEQAAQDI